METFRDCELAWRAAGSVVRMDDRGSDARRER